MEKHPRTKRKNKMTKQLPLTGNNKTKPINKSTKRYKDRRTDKKSK